MKKLLTACAVAGLSAAVFGDVTSANVVGYQNVDSFEGAYNYFVSTFDNVSGETPTLGDIKVDEDSYSASILSFLETDGSTKIFNIEGVGEVDGEFTYFTAYDLEMAGVKGDPGWYYDAGMDVGIFPVNYIEIPYGSAFYLDGQEDTALTFAGQVAKGDPLAIDVFEGAYCYTGNCTPIDLTLGDIGIDEDSYSASILSFLEADGSTKIFNIDGVGEVDGEFTYFTAYDLEMAGVKGDPGWYYDAGMDVGIFPVNYIEIPAGSVFYLDGQEDTFVTIPMAL